MAVTNSKKTWVVRIVLTVLTAAFVCWIYSNSLQNGAESTSVSERVRDFLQKAYSACFPQSDFVFSLHLVRKAAHFCEYALLGFLLYFTIKSYGAVLKSSMPIAGFSLIFVAVSDECLQFLSDGRAPAFLDVCIDLSGGVVGFFFAFALFVIFSNLKKRKTTKEETT